jgi:hypothetical protein
MLGPTLDKLKGDFPGLSHLDMVPTELVPNLPPVQEVLNTPIWQIAVPRNLREDVTALAISGLTKVPIDLSPFDPATGKDTRVTDQQRVKLLYPFASLYVADHMKSRVAEYMHEQQKHTVVANQLQSKIASYLASEAPKVAPAPPPPSSSLPAFQPPALERAANPLLRQTPAPPPPPWYTQPWVKIVGLAVGVGLVGGLAYQAQRGSK